MLTNKEKQEVNSFINSTFQGQINLNMTQCQYLCSRPEYHRNIRAENIIDTPNETQIKECIDEIKDYYGCTLTTLNLKKNDDLHNAHTIFNMLINNEDISYLLPITPYTSHKNNIKNSNIKNTLKNTNNINIWKIKKERFCHQLGWPNTGTDCWIDSFLYSIFMNTDLNYIINQNIIRNYLQLDTKTGAYLFINTGSDKEKYARLTIYCIIMYLNLLKKHDIPNTIKSKIKFCFLVFANKYINEYSKETQINTQTITWEKSTGDISPGGGNVDDLERFFMYLFPSNIYHFSDLELMNNTYDFKTFVTNHRIPTNNLIFLYTHNVGSYTQLKSYKKPHHSFLLNKNFNTFYNESHISGIFEKYFKFYNRHNMKTYILQSIIIGALGHQSSFTLCNGQWREYDNETIDTKKRNYKNTTAPNKIILKNDLVKLLIKRILLNEIVTMDLYYAADLSIKYNKNNITKRQRSNLNRNIYQQNKRKTYKQPLQFKRF